MMEEFLYVIFIDLHKACDAFDREKFMYTLEGYGVGYLSWRILRAYWDILHMVDRAGRYYGAVFKVFWGLTQGDPM